MSQRASSRARRGLPRLRRAVRSFSEPLESRLLLSTYTVTNTNDSGPGSLRDAIQNSLATSIVIHAAGAIPLSSQLEITRSLTITGPGANVLAVSGQNQVRVFQIDANVTAEIDGLTITNGHAPDGSNGQTQPVNGAPGNTGSAGADGGGILNLGTLTLAHDDVIGNVAGDGGVGGTGGRGWPGQLAPPPGTPGGPGGAGGTGGNGGGIYNGGTVNLVGDLLSDNRAGRGGTGGMGGDASQQSLHGMPGGPGGIGGPGGSGGALYTSGSLTAITSRIDGNSAGGGGIGGISGLGNSTNGAGGFGGSGGAVFVSNNGTFVSGENNIAANHAGNGADVPNFSEIGGTPEPAGNAGDGGALYCAGSAFVDSTTISDNFAGSGGNGSIGANGGNGGGIYAGGTLTLINSTVAENSGGNGSNGLSGNSSGSAGSGGGVFTMNMARLINDTIVRNGTGIPGTGGNFGVGGGIRNSASGSQTLSLGNTIVSQNTSPGSSDVSSASAVVSLGPNWFDASNPKLAPLANYGGPLPVMPPLPGSPVIAAGDPSLITDPPFSGPPFTDEEGQPRLGQSPSGTATVDIGAVQFREIPLVVTTTADGGDTPNAMTLRSAIALADLIRGDDTITFNVPATDPGYNPSSGIFAIHLSGGALEISDPSGTITIQGPGVETLTIDGGGASSVLKVDANASAAASGLTITGGQNGIANQGTLSVSQAAITNNTAAGILNSGTLTIANSTVTHNSGGGLSSSGTLSASRCTIQGNTGQGGVASTGTLTLAGCTLSANTSDRYGGGVSTAAAATITNCTFSGNNADLGGGGISISAGAATLTNCTITSNLVNGSGGGVEILGGNLSLYNTIVAGNSDAFPAADDIDGTLDANLAPGQRASSFNLIGTGGSGGLADGTNGNLVGIADPKLGPLANNGGPTQTIALLPGSPAIDHGSNALANAAGPSTDQRGFGRIYNRTVDIGAYELGSALPGDLNHDGSVNFADLLALAQHYGATNATWEQGDLNGDGSVDFADLLTLAQDYGQGTPSAAVLGARSSFAFRHGYSAASKSVVSIPRRAVAGVSKFASTPPHHRVL